MGDTDITGLGPSTVRITAQQALQAATPLRRLRLPLDAHDSDLVIVGDSFEEGGRYVQAEVPRAESEAWTWLDWDDLYDRLTCGWHARTERLAVPKSSGE